MERELSLEFVRGLAQAFSGLRVRDEENSIPLRRDPKGLRQPTLETLEGLC